MTAVSLGAPGAVTGAGGAGGSRVILLLPRVFSGRLESGRAPDDLHGAAENPATRLGIPGNRGLTGLVQMNQREDLGPRNVNGTNSTTPGTSPFCWTWRSC